MLRELFCSGIVVSLVSKYSAATQEPNFGPAVTELSLKYTKKFSKDGFVNSILINSQTFYKMMLLTYFLTTGESRREVEKFLGLKMDYKEALEQFKVLDKQNITGVDDGYRVYYDSKYKLNDISEQVLGDHVSAIKFSDGNATQQITDWAETVTKGKIATLGFIKIKKNTTMVLVGVTSMTLKFKSKYEGQKTLFQKFLRLFNMTTYRKMIKLTGPYEYRDSKELNCDILKIPYENDRLFLVIFLPHKSSNLTMLIKSLDYTNINSELKKMVKKNGTLFIPEFRTNNVMSLERRLSLWSLPITLSVKAEFGAFTNSSGLRLNKIITAEDLDINNYWTTASSATSSSAQNVTYESSFLHMVYDITTESPLEMGTYVDEEEFY